MLVCSLALAGAVTCLAEAEVAMGDERAHSEFDSYCQGLAVVAFGCFGTA
jgi:hypothetical protein